MSSNSGTNLHPDGGDGGGAAVAPPPGYALSGKIMLIVIVVLFTTVLLILFIHLYLRWRLFRRRTSFRRRHLVFAGEGSAPPAASRGLEPKVIRSLPVLIISDSSAAVEGAAGAECAVCLSEFEAGEKARELPRCGHRFHIDCIDMWFHSHDTCPLCRATVEAPPAPAPAPVMGPATESSIAAGTEERIESSSASDRDGGELRIEVPMRRGMGEEELGLGLRLGLGLGSPAVKSPGSRFLLLRRLVSCRDLLVDRGSELDLERGEGAAPVFVPVVAM